MKIEFSIVVDIDATVAFQLEAQITTIRDALNQVMRRDSVRYPTKGFTVREVIDK